MARAHGLCAGAAAHHTPVSQPAQGGDFYEKKSCSRANSALVSPFTLELPWRNLFAGLVTAFLHTFADFLHVGQEAPELLGLLFELVVHGRHMRFHHLGHA